MDEAADVLDIRGVTNDDGEYTFQNYTRQAFRLTPDMEVAVTVLSYPRRDVHNIGSAGEAHHTFVVKDAGGTVTKSCKLENCHLATGRELLEEMGRLLRGDVGIKAEFRVEKSFVSGHFFFQCPGKTASTLHIPFKLATVLGLSTDGKFISQFALDLLDGFMLTTANDHVVLAQASGWASDK